MTIRWTTLSLAGLALVAGLSVAGCHHECHAKAPAAAALPPGVKAPGEATIGDKTLCLVSGEEFTITEKSPKTVYEGKTYYFCCPGCDTKFAANPSQFLKK